MHAYINKEDEPSPSFHRRVCFLAIFVVRNTLHIFNTPVKRQQLRMRFSVFVFAQHAADAAAAAAVDSIVNHRGIAVKKHALHLVASRRLVRYK